MSDKRFPANIISSTPVEPSGSFQDDAASGTWSLQEAFSYVKAGLWPTAGNQKPLIEDVFSTYLYTGNGSTQTITNGIDLAGEGGITWIKSRTQAESHSLTWDNSGTLEVLTPDQDFSSAVVGNRVTSFNSDGFSIGDSFVINGTGETYASWTFRKAPRFFDVVTYTGNGTTQTISHNLGTDVGFIVVKQTSGTTNWGTWDRASGDGRYMSLNTTSAAASITPTAWIYNVDSSSFTTGNDSWSNASGGTYVAYLFAHDPLGPSGDGSDGLIACGSYTGDGTTDGSKLVNIGWEPQWLLIKNTSVSENWLIIDNMRGAGYDNTTTLFANLNQGDATSGREIWTMDPQGFRLSKNNSDSNQSGNNYIYIAIRRGPMRAPTSGTEVFAVDNGDGSSVPSFTSGFPVDFGMLRDVGVDGFHTSSRLTSGKTLDTYSTAAEGSNSIYRFDYQSGWFGYALSSNYYSWMFRRAPGFFDVVAYSGDGVAGRTVPHNLGVAPELMIVKSRSDAQHWGVWCSYTPTKEIYLNLSGSYGDGNTATASSTTITLQGMGGTSAINASGQTYIAYLFATLPGVSKVGSYTGNGTSQTIDCGFTSGARFVLIKRTDSTGDWYVWDTARGIVTGNDPFLELNTTDAEVTSDDSIDPDSSGFIVNQTATTNVNVSSATYIFYAIA